MLLFRPQASNMGRRWPRRENFNLTPRLPTSPKQYDLPLNEAVIGRIFSRVHYLTSHSPMVVRKQYANLDRLWYKRLNIKGSVDFVNKHSLNRFL